MALKSDSRERDNAIGFRFTHSSLARTSTRETCPTKERERETMTPLVVVAPRPPRCLLPLLLLLLFRVVSSSSSKSFERKKSPFEWTTCQNGTDVSIVSAELSPDPVRPGGAATFVLRGVVTSDDGVPDSAVIDVDIRYQSVPVYRDVLKLCETVRKNDDENGETTTGCPIRKKKGNGTTTRVIMEYDAKVPELAPSGEFDARFLAKRRSDDDDDDDDVGDVFCVEATLQVKGPFHQRGLDAREKEESDDDDDWVEENEATLQVKGPFHQRGLDARKEEDGDYDDDDWVEENERGIIKVS